MRRWLGLCSSSIFARAYANAQLDVARAIRDPRRPFFFSDRAVSVGILDTDDAFSHERNEELCLRANVGDWREW